SAGSSTSSWPTRTCASSRASTRPSPRATWCRSSPRWRAGRSVPVALPWGRSLTVEDVDALPDDGHRYELLDGTLLVTPAPATIHQRIVLRLAALLLAAKGPEHDVLPAPTDWVVSPSTKFQPDVIVAYRAEGGELRLERAP